MRQALAYAIDRRQIVDVLLNGSVPVLQSVVRPAQLGYAPAFEGYAHDPDRAAALLEEAGWTRGGDGIFEKDGRDARDPGRVLLRERAAPHDRAAHGRPGPRGRHPHRAHADARPTGSTAARSTWGTSPRRCGVRRRRGSEPHRAPRQRPDPDGGERVPRPERVPVERSGGRQPDAPLRPGGRRRAARPRRSGEIQDIVARQVPLIPLYAQPNTVAYVDALQGVKVNPTQAEVFWNSAEWSLAR